MTDANPYEGKEESLSFGRSSCALQRMSGDLIEKEAGADDGW